MGGARGIEIDPTCFDFPHQLATIDDAYLPELILFATELLHRNLEPRIMCPWPLGQFASQPTYVYGRIGSKDQPHVFPYDGRWLDNKLNLGLFSQIWGGHLVKVPPHYISRFEAWGEIPREVILKFCDKGSKACARARQSVIFNKPSGKAPFLKRCYKVETLLAQSIVRPTKLDGNNCQLIILAIGDKPITGYVQYSQNDIINDNSIHGPLQIS